MNNSKIEKGDILVSVWGYSMTIVNWYKVVDTTPKMVKLQEIGSKVVSGDGQEGWAMPDESYTEGEIITRKNKDGQVKINSSEYAEKWDGKAVYFSYLD